MTYDLSNASDEMAKYVIPGKVEVMMGYFDEGRSGDYDAEDPKDIPLCRFEAIDLVHPLEDGPKCRSQQDNSYCTLLPATLDAAVLESVCRFIAESVVELPHWKRTLEGHSWINKEQALRIHRKYQEET
jgi:hypothetical protein